MLTLRQWIKSAHLIHLSKVKQLRLDMRQQIVENRAVSEIHVQHALDYPYLVIILFADYPRVIVNC